jgi:holo-[acyl-carrier protein] synthase
MIYGIGVDLIRVERIEQALSRWGQRFEARIFTPAEVESSRRRHRPGSHLAMRFAAKEAFSKAVGLGLRSAELLWRDIEVAHDPRGKPFLRLHGTAAAVAARIGLTATHVSLTDEAGLAQAFVIVEV